MCLRLSIVPLQFSLLIYHIFAIIATTIFRRLVVFTNECIITPIGLDIIGGILGKSDFVKRCNRMPVDKKHSEPQIKNGDILLTYIGLLCQANTSFDSVNEMKDDPEFYKDVLVLFVAWTDDIGSSIRGQILHANADMFRTHNVTPAALPTGEVPLDIDVTPLDNSKSCKEGVSRTYKGFDGYAPIMAYIGKEEFLVNTELREGRQHCQKGTPRFLKETLRLSHELTDARSCYGWIPATMPKKTSVFCWKTGDSFCYRS